MCEDILKQRKRLGGNWMVDRCILTKEFRELIRKKLGSGLIIVELQLNEELCKKRVLKRHGEDNEWDKTVANMLLEVYPQCEFAEQDEENIFTIEVTEEITPEVVANEILILLEGTDT